MEKYTLSLCLHLKKKGIQSDVLTLNKCSKSNTILAEKSNYKGIKIMRIPFLDLGIYKISPQVINYVKNYDLIHVQGTNFFSDFLASTKPLHKKKIVISTHGGIFHTKSNSKIKKFYFSTICKRTLKKADLVIAVSRNDFNLFKRITENIALIEEGAEVKEFSLSKSKKEKNSFAFVGRISKNKRVDNLIKTLALVAEKHPSLKIYIIGPDWEGLQDWLIQLAKEKRMEKNIFFRGKMKEKELKKFLAKTEFFASASEYEGFGISAIEAMASGAIPLLNDIDSFNNFVKDGENGFIIEFSKPEKAAEKIIKIMQMSNKKNGKIARSAKESVKKYDWGNTVQKTINAYNKILGIKNGFK